MHICGSSWQLAPGNSGWRSNGVTKDGTKKDLDDGQMDRKWIPESEQSIKIGRVYTQVARNQERRRKADMLPMTHQNSVHLFKTY